MIDEVFPMNEVTQLRIFGKASDVYEVNFLIHERLD